MSYRIILAVLMLAFGFSFADEATQTDWSGGPRVYGPVSDWDSSFSTSDMINCAITGLLRLGREVLADPIEHAISGYFRRAIAVYATDVDGDGDNDVLGASSDGNDIVWWENANGSGTSWLKHIIHGNFHGAKSVYATDIDGDGDTDVLGMSTYYTDHNVTWWENIDGSGTSWTQHTIDGDFDGAYSVYAADVDGDGDTDVLGAAKYDDDIAWWENVNGSGTSWTEHTIDGDFDGAYSVYAADVDGDGDTDVLGAAWYADDITWWENENGSGTSWTEHTIDDDLYGAISVYATDVDGDGDTDVLGAVRWACDITWWENENGSGTSWIEHMVDDDFSGASSVYATDVDGDGDTDVLGAGRYDDIVWWENVGGSGTSWTEHIVFTDYDGAISVYATDIDGDGDTDVLGASYWGDKITWWKVVAAGYSADGFLESSILEIPWPTDDLIKWGEITWQGSEPAATEISFQVRASDDPDYMGTWSDTIFTSGTSLEGFLDEYDNYFQYRTILETADTDSTPVLNDITISWDILVYIEDPPSISGEFALYGSLVNPAFDGSVTIGFAIPEQNVVELNIFDLSGRLVIKAASEDFSAGEHAITVSDLRPGVYFIQMKAGEFSARESMVILD